MENNKGDTWVANNQSKRANCLLGNNKEDVAPFYPIPDKTADLLRESPAANFSLCFPRLTQWIESNGTIKKTEPNPKKGRQGTIEELCDIANKNMQTADDVLKRYQKQQQDYLASLEKQGIQTLTLYARLTSPFITGLGSGHPTETGMILDRNTGLPYLPASSIKGVLRLAYAITIANDRPEVPDSELLAYFGNTDTNHAIRGQIVFLDAYPYTVPHLKLDIMNPHFGKYYSSVAESHSIHKEQASQSKNGQKNMLPLETESPVPLKFLTVEEGVVFVFRAFFLPLQKKVQKDVNGAEKSSVSGTTEPADGFVYNTFSEKDKTDLHKAFTKAFTRIGFGGKTAIGYGRFTEIAKEKAERSSKVSLSADNLTEKKRDTSSAILSPQNNTIHKAKIIGQTKKGSWKVVLCDFPDYTGPITDSSNVQNGAVDALIKVKITSAKPNNSIFQYAGAVDA